MSPRPPGEPTIEELQALDAFLDALAASTPVRASVSAGLEPGLAAVAGRLSRLPGAEWEAVAPLYQPSAPVVEPGPPDGIAPVVEITRARRLGPAGRTPRRLGRRPAAVAWVATAAAVLVVLAVVAANTFSGQPPKRPVTGVSPVPAPWRLAGFIDTSAWQQTSSAALASDVGIACPAAGTCYADNPGSSRGSAVVTVTTDNGTTWRTAPLPAGSRLTSDVTCPSAEECLAGGAVNVAVAPAVTGGGSVLFATTDGGGSWTSRRIPDVAQLVALDCPTATDCIGAGVGPATAADPEGPSVAVRTTDGGVAWTVIPLPVGFSASRLTGLSCTTAGDCAMVGTTVRATTGTPVGVGAALYSTDGGAVWTAGTVPSGLALIWAVSCPSATVCVAVGNRPASATSTGATTAASVGATEALSTSDGGRSWALTSSAGLPAVHLTAISCPTTTDCWASGRLIGSSNQTGTIVSTRDGGATWTTETLPTTLTPAQQQSTQLARLDLENVPSVSCQIGGHCVAMAVQGSSATSTEQYLALHN